MVRYPVQDQCAGQATRRAAWGGEGGCDGVIVEGSGVVGFEVRDRRVGRQDQGRERGKHGGMRGALPGGGNVSRQSGPPPETKADMETRDKVDVGPAED